MAQDQGGGVDRGGRILAWILVAALLATAALGATSATSASPRRNTPPNTPTVSFGGLGALAAQVAHAPEPVRGTDGRWHVVYELYLLNTADVPLRLVLIEAIDARTGRVVARFDTPERIRAVTTTSTTRDPGVDELPPNAGGVVFLDVTADRRAALPEQLVHRFVSQVGTRTMTFRGARTTTSRHTAVRLAPPLVGGRYLDANGCCGISAHTRAVLTVDGQRYLAQRFAIDWLRLDDHNRLYVGDWRRNENWVIFGDPVVSASGGRVVETLNTMPENTPPTPASNLTPYTALGNHVIVDMGDGRYALYAHLQPGSVAVRVGQRVRPGQLLGRVGNTGSSSAPHLHFHVTDAAAAVSSNGTPWVFDRFRYSARALNLDELSADEPAPVAVLQDALSRRQRTDELPLQGDVVAFPGDRQAVLGKAKR